MPEWVVRMVRRGVLLVALVGIVGLGVAGCGSSAGDGTASQAVATAPPDDDACVTASEESDWSVAKVICTEAAELGNPEAMNRLALDADRIGDTELATSWWERAAALGNVNAMNNLGLKARSEGDVEAATSWYEKAAALGDARAMHHLGRLAQQAGDLKLAESWWQRAAELGDPDAVQALGESG